MPGVSPTMGRRRVGGVLRALREGAKLSNDDASKRAGISTAKLSRLESGHNVVAVKDVKALLSAYKADKATKERVVGLAHAAEQHGWWHEFDDVLPADFDLYLSVEEAAASLLVFSSTIVHGLLQTEEYAREWMRKGDPGMPNHDLARLLSLRMGRQTTLTRDTDPLQLWAILDEGALRRTVGGPEVMRDQLWHLLQMSELPNVTLQVLPFDVGAHHAASGSFSLIEFTEPTDPEIGYVDCAAGNVYPEKPPQVRRLKTSFYHLTSTAMEPVESLTFIRKVYEEMT